MTTDPPPGGDAVPAPSDSPDDDPYAIENGFILCAMETRDNESNGNISYKVTFPAALEHALIVYRDDTVYWECDTVQGQVLISDQKEPWRSSDRFERVSSSSVSEQRVTTIPRKLFEGYTSPYSSEKAQEADQVDDVFHLRNRHLYYAVAPPVCLAEYGATFFVPVEDMVEIWGTDIAEKFTDDDHDLDPYLEAAAESPVPEPDDEDRGGEPA